MKRTLTALILAAALAGCAGGTTDTAAPADEKTTDVASAKPKASKNPLKTDENVTACRSARRSVAKYSGVFEEVGKGTALPEDGAKAAQNLQKEMAEDASYSTGDVQVQTAALADAYGRMRVSLTTGDADGLGTAIEEQNTAIAALDKDCTSIGE